MSSKPPERLYFAVREDIPTGRATAQIAHAMDEWAALHGPQQGTVVVYSVEDEGHLLEVMPAEGRTILWREPDLSDEATAFAADAGPLDLPLYRGHRRRARR